MNDLNEKLESISDQILATCYAAEEAGRGLTDSEAVKIQNLEKEQTRVRMAIKAQQAGQRGSEMLDQHIAKHGGETTTITKPVQANFTSKSVFNSQQDARDAGQFVLAVFGNDERAFSYCKSKGIIKNAMKTGDNTKGGFAVPEPLENAIVELRETYGRFRQDSFLYPMSSGVVLVPKVAGEVTSYYMGEGDPSVAITSSDMALSQIKLEAKKLATFTPLSSEIDEDAAVPIAEMLARSIAWKFSYDEDNAGFNGDGTSTYGGIVGLAGALAAGSKVTATGRQTFGALTMADFETVIGQAKEWAGYTPSWYISKKGWTASMQRLLDATGGSNIKDLAEGAPKMFLGYPVKIVQSLPSALTGTTGTPACYFGDLRLGTYFGTRRGVNVAVDSSYYFAQDCLAVRATQRYDINVHDRGDATNAGGLIQLVFG